MTRFTPLFALVFVSTGIADAGDIARIEIRSVRQPQAVGATFVDVYGVTRDDVERIAAIPGVRRVVPIREITMPVRYSARETSATIVGTTPEFADAVGTETASGRFLVAKDDGTRNNVAILNLTAARKLFPDGDALGRNVKIDGDYFLVVGEARDERGEERAIVYVPLSTMRARFGDLEVRTSEGAFERLQFEVTTVFLDVDADDSQRVRAAVEQVLAESHPLRDFVVREAETRKSRSRGSRP